MNTSGDPHLPQSSLLNRLSLDGRAPERPSLCSPTGRTARSPTSRASPTSLHRVLRGPASRPGRVSLHLVEADLARSALPSSKSWRSIPQSLLCCHRKCSASNYFARGSLRAVLRLTIFPSRRGRCSSLDVERRGLPLRKCTRHRHKLTFSNLHHSSIK